MIMNEEELFESIGTIDDSLIRRSEQAVRTYKFAKWGSVAAVLVLVASMGTLYIRGNMDSTSSTSTSDAAAMIAEIDNGGEESGDIADLYEVAEAEVEEKVTEDVTISKSSTDNSNGNDIATDKSMSDNTTADTCNKPEDLRDGISSSQSQMSGSTSSASSSTADDYAGNTGGADIPVDESAYKGEKEYSDELIDLQNKISTAMGNGELPFVIESAIYENPDRLHVVVTTDDEDLINKLKAYDTTGELLEIEYRSSNDISDLPAYLE
jgi:hypothetical protein